MQIEEFKPYIFSCSGEDLAKVLLYYGLIPDVSQIEQKIICPFHGDVNPSMIVDMEKGSFYCFGCYATGDALKFVELMNKNLNTLQAVLKFFEVLKSKKVEKVDLSGRHKKIKPKRQSYNIAHDYYYGLSKIDWINDKSEEVTSVKNYMLERGFSKSILNKCGAKITYNKSYPIIFPMLDNGKFRGWVCRTNNPDIEKKRKYLYNEGFSRRDTLVGNYKGYDKVFVVEGYMDKLKFNQFGVDNVVAILGWKMSIEQEQKLKKAGVKQIISALDNDECGKKGTEYLKTRFDNVIRFCYLKNIKDAGEMSKHLFDKMLNKTLGRSKKNGPNNARQVDSSNKTYVEAKGMALERTVAKRVRFQEL